MVKGSHASPETKKKLSDVHLRLWQQEEYRTHMIVIHTGKIDEKSSHWKGNSVGYSGIHKWIKRKLGKPNKCDRCGIENAVSGYDWANVSGQYKRDITDWIRLCKKCHCAFDDLVNKMWITRKSRRESL